MNDFNVWKPSNGKVSRGPKLQKVYGGFVSRFDQLKQNKSKHKCIRKAKPVLSIFCTGVLSGLYFL